MSAASFKSVKVFAATHRRLARLKKTRRQDFAVLMDEAVQILANAQHPQVPFETNGPDRGRNVTPTPMGNQPSTPTPPSVDAHSQGSVTDDNVGGKDASSNIHALPTNGNAN